VVVDSLTYERASALVDRQLGYEIARYVFGTEAEFARRLKVDDGVSRASKLLRGVTSQRELLERAK
jgi:hypothetical protein